MRVQLIMNFTKATQDIARDWSTNFESSLQRSSSRVPIKSQYLHNWKRPENCSNNQSRWHNVMEINKTGEQKRSIQRAEKKAVTVILGSVFCSRSSTCFDLLPDEQLMHQFHELIQQLNCSLDSNRRLSTFAEHLRRFFTRNLLPTMSF